MLSTDAPPRTIPKFPVQELKDQKVEFQLQYPDWPIPRAGIGTFFIIREKDERGALICVEVLEINWNAVAGTLDRLPLDQRRVDCIERHPEAKPDGPLYRLLA